MKIIIDENREVLKETNKIGNDSENKVEVLEFEFPKQYTAFTKYIEFQIKNEKYVDLIENDQYVITRAIAKYGKIKAQVVLRNSLDNDVAVFKSNIFDLKISNSLNATEDVPTEYPTWIDNLTKLKQDLESSESERISNEGERISAEKERQESFTEMQNTVENAASSIKDLKEEYNSNAEKETKKFNDNALEQTKSFNENSGTKLAEYNKTHTDKMKEFNNNYDAKTKAFDDNAAAKLEAYNKNDTEKTNAYNANDKAKTDVYNNNTVLKEKAYNNNASNKTETFNSNAESKQNKYDQNAENKLTEYNQNAEELINKVEQVQAENEALKAENKLIKEQIPSATASGNSVHVEDSGSLDFGWKIKGGHYQKQTVQSDNLLILEDTTITINGITLVIKDGVITINGTSTASTNIDFKIKKKLKAGTYRHVVQRDSGSANGNISFLIMKSSGSVSTMNGSGGANFTLEEDTEVFYRIWTDKNNIISNVAYKCLISEGSDSKPWVQGIPDSSSIDYPSKIETVGSNVNEFDCKESYTDKGLTLTKYKDGSFKIEGTATVTTTFAISNYFKLQGVYTFKAEWLEGTSPYFWFYSNINKKNTVELTSTNGVKVVTLNNEDETILGINIEKDKAYSFTARVKIERGSTVSPYSPYGMGSVEIDVSNENLFNEQYIQGYFVNDSGKTNTSAEGARADDYIPVSDNKTIYVLFKCLKSCTLARFWLMEFDENYNTIKRTTTGIYDTSFNIGNTIKQLNLSQKCKYIKPSFYSLRDGGASLTYDKFNEYFNISISRNQTEEYIKHQSQTAIMPIQQEMLEGGYVADVEHHEWEKLVLTGDEGFVQAQNVNKLNYFYLSLNSVKIKGKIISNMLKNIESGIIWNKTSYDDVVSSASNSKTINIMLSDTTITTLQQFKEKLKELYNAGTPVIIYYKLAEPIDLELTSEQKTVREQKLYTYKNITNISLSDELASIDVKYKKDLETEHNKLQNEIDEIKQLLSTTQTSALLLDNMQNDIESEVE